jgi:integrase
MKPYPYTRRYNDRGKVRIEYRRYGRTIALTGEPGTMEFQQSYEDAKARMDEAIIVPNEDGIARPAVVKQGTFRWLCVEWFKSAEFGQLGEQTRREHRRRLELICQEPAAPGSPFLFGNYPVPTWEAKHVKVLRDRKKDTPHAANHRLTSLRLLFDWAIDRELVKGPNPADIVAKLKATSEGHHTWTDEELEQYRARWPVGTIQRLALELFFHTGQRLGDVRRFGPHTIVNGKLVFTQEKNKARKPVHLELPIRPELQAILEATKTGAETFLIRSDGKRFASNTGLGNWFREACNEAGLPQCSAHGIRKASATFLADNGATTNELMAVHGWRSMRSAEGYVRAANQKELAAKAMARGSDPKA